MLIKGRLSLISLLVCLVSVNSWADVATFAGGCFWCMESPFEKLSGVKSVISGYAGGTRKNPTYKQVASGQTKHVEAVQVTYDPKLVSYSKLLNVFWRQIDPTDGGGQFVDRGFQYSSAIFTHNDQQKKIALKSFSVVNALKPFKNKVVTRVTRFSSFYPAEDYHQDYYKKTPLTKAKYKYYRYRSGRDQFIEKNWSHLKQDLTDPDVPHKKSIFVKPSQTELKRRLSKIQYEVTQHEGTERPFKNEYWDNKRAGIYVDIVSGEPLFSSLDKYKSGTGWPSFTRPLHRDSIVEKEDRKLFTVRTEVRSKLGDSHLGHVFKDGPAPTGLRYCINSAALRFIPVEELKKEGYERYLSLYKGKK